MDQNQDIYAKAFAELTSIDSQIAALEKRRGALRQFVDLGQKLFAPALPPNPFDLPRPAGGFRPFSDAHRAVARESSMKARILGLAEQAIKARGPQSTAALLEFVEAAGVEVTGAHKPTTVSVILSRDDRFKSDRKVGWTLVEPIQKELTPQDARTSAGSSTA